MTTENKPYFSFEVLPPLRGKGIDSIYRTIDRLMPFDPAYINITTHRYDTLYSELANGTYKKLSVLNRPGTVAIAAAIKERYKVRTVPHIVCSGFTAAEIESELIDLSYLGITDLLLLRGDKAKSDNRFIPTPEGHAHAIDLCQQINRFNNGQLLGGVQTEMLTEPFTYGVAGYPEKHDEAMNMETDIENLKAYIRLTRELDKEVAILAGNDGAILTCLKEGGAGGIAGRANIWPETVAKIYDCFKAGDLEGAQAAQDAIAILQQTFKYGNPNTIIKTAVALQGHPVGKCRAPFNYVPEEGMEAIKKVLAENEAKGLH